MYVCQIQGIPPLEKIKEKTDISSEQVNDTIDILIKNQLVNDDRTTLTEIGRNSLKVVLAGGGF